MPGWPITPEASRPGGAKLWRAFGRLKRLERDDGPGVLNAGNDLHLLVHEMPDVGRILDIELHLQIEIAGRGIDLRGDFGIRDGIRHLVRLAEMAFDLDEEGNHLGVS